jgi:hypothetical protein
MKDKNLPPDNSSQSLEELTNEANNIIESLEAEKDLQNSTDSYQELLKLNNIIEKKFHKTAKIIKLKKRPINHPLIVHYYNVIKLKEDCHINSNFTKLYKKFSPGPITYVLKLKKNSKISKYVTNNQKSLAVRFPKHSLFKN